MIVTCRLSLGGLTEFLLVMLTLDEAAAVAAEGGGITAAPLLPSVISSQPLSEPPSGSSRMLAGTIAGPPPDRMGDLKGETTTIRHQLM